MQALLATIPLDITTQHLAHVLETEIAPTAKLPTDVNGVPVENVLLNVIPQLLFLVVLIAC